MGRFALIMSEVLSHYGFNVKILLNKMVKYNVRAWGLVHYPAFYYSASPDARKENSICHFLLTRAEGSGGAYRIESCLSVKMAFTANCRYLNESFIEMFLKYFSMINIYFG